ncbi:dihydrofolate reductase [Sediminibacillus dalangtanensis]|uniref:Dihydrofolate reductase n=1 Tax=Sediminibacillus dalangtanensis TaxID=2729421 RepID=A0ABX7VVH1_9BACI|nr:dihydrofolate reductase [Sediminibacillus dalangtanensis]QTM99600.1 dihydrofolate reductase [Sediminibacillus dalangtanensis]
MISLLYAMDRNSVIGYQSDLPWRLPNDLKFFKQMTTGNTIIMGRKTFASMNGPLPNRENVIVTKDKSFQADDCLILHSVEEIVKWSEKDPETELFVIGGEEIFRQVLPYADRMYMTFIDETFPGDTFFPAYNEKDWKLTKKVLGEKNERNPYDYYFLQYDRIGRNS